MSYFRYYVYRHQFLEYHRSNQISNPILITPHCIIMKPGAHVRDNGRIEGVSSYQGVKYSPCITIGANVGIEQNVHITCANRITIGANTSIAANVSITDINHPYEDVKLPIERQILQVKEVIIGDDCKIYNGSIILPGVHIGKHVCVGANSVVTRDIPDYCVAVGSPAYIIKRYNFETQKWDKTDKQGNFLE